jgi:hypothetical protein
MRDRRTVSEALFEELCDLQGRPWRRLPVLQDARQPDYVVTLGAQGVAVEVKQIDPNADDEQFAKTLAEVGWAAQSRNPDAMAERVRNHIDGSRGQFTSHLERSPCSPTILVLFDNANNRYTDPYTIQIAMFGFERAELRVTAARMSAVIVDQGFGARNNAAVRAEKNQQLSALATLHEFSDPATHERRLALCFYHNYFATVPLVPNWWCGTGALHFRLSDKVPGQYQDWVQIIS